jgi:hypothetical protein
MRESLFVAAQKSVQRHGQSYDPLGTIWLHLVVTPMARLLQRSI